MVHGKHSVQIGYYFHYQSSVPSLLAENQAASSLFTDVSPVNHGLSVLLTAM